MNWNYTKVKDARNKPVRGLWLRGNCFYAQTTVNGKSKRLPLNATFKEDAIKEIGRLTARNGDAIPSFSDVADDYTKHILSLKRPATIACERVAIKQWKRVFDRPVNTVTISHILEWRTAKLKTSTGRTVNLYIAILLNVLQYARTQKFLTEVPSIPPVSYVTPRKPLLTAAEIEKVCEVGGTALRDLILFLAYSGMRISEALRILWRDIDLERDVISIGSDGLAKNGECRFLDMNEKLRAHVLQLPVSSGGSRPVFHLFNIQQAERCLKAAAKGAGIPHFNGFHLLRHYFASQCSAAGVDWLTLARWLGHKDNGILIAKTYGHLSNEHTAKMADKLTNL